ncbi:uncharacterized protein EKO05_0007541 [Ascochyta rabiei]|uniref:Uncharacterized protein n=1 Tax=Didymella rabiei TaxID=5454 RepID=A0A162YHX4_DIDRA|nr:uncharacterized protein EKO05_0007541 [Ascochyta rabiei]KZM20053.1 hypothetical protein ST47_g8798 [Ascochyta rabiei]UPX17168.1 hypothetical protein EKO05_0007541 [Ascochyta rabiei]
METIEFILQLLSAVFAALGIIVTIGSIDRRWSLAAIIYRKICSKDIDWEAERRRWQDAYRIDVDIENLSHEYQQESEGRSTLLRTWSNRLDNTVVAGHGVNCDEPTDTSVLRLPPMTEIETLLCLGSKEPTTPPDNVTHPERKVRNWDKQPSKPRCRSYAKDMLRQPLVMCSSRRGGRRRLATSGREPVSFNEVCKTAG